MLTISSDDWNRVKADWTGVAATRIPFFKPEDATGACKSCGSTDVEIGARQAAT